MANVSDPAILEAYNDVRDDKTPSDWLLLSYEDEEKGNNIKLTGTGSGGLAEFVSQLQANKAHYGYLRINVANDELSKRSKFVLVIWCGPEVKVMRKAKLSVHLADVKNVLKSFAIEVSASDKNELKEETIKLLLKKAMGANYDRQSSGY